MTANDKKKYFEKASLSIRKRFPLIIHKKGDEFNQVFNFILRESYMQPHMHPASKMIEKMHLISGSFKLIIFRDNGEPLKVYNVDKNNNRIAVPSFTWHTYVMTSKKTIVFETMEGVYDPKTWKKIPAWAPEESNIKAKEYYENLKKIY